LGAENTNFSFQDPKASVVSTSQVCSSARAQVGWCDRQGQQSTRNGEIKNFDFLRPTNFKLRETKPKSAYTNTYIYCIINM
jgi:hypothetical protein